MKTGLLTDPYGNTVGGGGPQPAIDGNHSYVYNCTEPTGSRTLGNSGVGIDGALTLQGTENTDYMLSSYAIGRGAESVRFINSKGVGGAWSNTSCFMTGGSITIEAFIIANWTGGGTIIQAQGATIAYDYILIETTSTPSTYHATVCISGVAKTTANFIIEDNVGATHVLASYDGTTGVLSMYVNGILNATATYGAANSLAPMIALSIGNKRNSTALSYRGWITQARFSNIARSASYALSTCETLFAM